MTVVIHHNPKCSTSRKVLGMIRDAGGEPVIIEYLRTGWSVPQLQGLFAAAGVSARQAMRTRRSPAEELGLLDPEVGEAAILEAMVAHPELVERPIVCTPKGVRLCRPVELLSELIGSDDR